MSKITPLPALPADLSNRPRAAAEIMPRWVESDAAKFRMSQASTELVAAWFAGKRDDVIVPIMKDFHESLTRYLRDFVDPRITEIPACTFSGSPYDDAYVPVIMTAHAFTLADLKRNLRSSDDYTEIREVSDQGDEALYDLAFLILTQGRA
ncbi:hypothetical protein GCM10029978_067770 [Actinoallomurus acanthiterrae]